MSRTVFSRRRCRTALWLMSLALAVSGVFVLTTTVGRGQALVADVSQHLIAITTGFTGTEVVLFGAVDEEGGDVAVVVTGPRRSITVRRKDRVAGIWINRVSVTFRNVPGFYAVATSRPLKNIVEPAVLGRHEIGVDNLVIRPVGTLPADTIHEFRQSLIRNMKKANLFQENQDQVTFLGERLFRTNLYFPANVPTGIYTIGVFLVRTGDIISAQTTPLAVSKVGLSAEIYELAQRRPFLYGWGAIVGAVAIGWLAGALFRA